MAEWVIWECRARDCRLRFPAAVHEAVRGRCPRCGGEAAAVRRLHTPDETAVLSSGPRRTIAPPLAALLDNVRSVFNVGSIFRSADGAGVHHLYLCGVTPTPAHPKLAKTALGAELSVGWSQHTNALLQAQALLADGWTLWALEEDAASQSLWECHLPAAPVVLVVGSEVTGVDPDVRALCHATVAIPMQGRKRSLNVATAFGVAAVLLGERIPGSSPDRSCLLAFQQSAEPL